MFTYSHSIISSYVFPASQHLRILITYVNTPITSKDLSPALPTKPFVLEGKGLGINLEVKPHKYLLVLNWTRGSYFGYWTMTDETSNICGRSYRWLKCRFYCWSVFHRVRLAFVSYLIFSLNVSSLMFVVLRFRYRINVSLYLYSFSIIWILMSLHVNNQATGGISRRIHRVTPGGR